MTLLAGIICKDGIVIATDSQTTKGALKQIGTNKITVVNCGGIPVLIAEAGIVALSNQATNSPTANEFKICQLAAYQGSVKQEKLTSEKVGEIFGLGAR